MNFVIYVAKRIRLGAPTIILPVHLLVGFGKTDFIPQWFKSDSLMSSVVPELKLQLGLIDYLFTNKSVVEII